MLEVEAWVDWHVSDSPEAKQLQELLFNEDLRVKVRGRHSCSHPAMQRCLTLGRLVGLPVVCLSVDCSVT